MNKWIVIVTRVDARIFKEKPFQRVGTLLNALGREKNRAMTTDKPSKNRSKFAGYKGVHTMNDANPHEDAAVDFAKKVAEYLRKAQAQNRFTDLTLVAESKMMGRVKKEMHRTLLNRTEFVNKDMGHAKIHDLAKTFRVGRALSVGSSLPG